ncbi:MAG: hypothetical protein ACO35C_04910 [Pontimonas sp.]
MDRARDRARAMLERDVFPDDPEEARRLEKVIYNHVIRTTRQEKIAQTWKHPIFRSRYVQKVIAVKFNITNPKNTALRDKVRDGTASYEWLMQAQPKDLFPELWEPIYHSVAMKQLKKQLTENPEDVPDGIEQCRRCKSRKVVYTQLQTRSADEPMTSYFRCVACHNSWKY